MACSTGFLLCSLLGYGLFPCTVAAQDTLDTRLATVFTDGVNAFDAEDYAGAIPLLLRVFKADPAFYQPGRGSAAYWLGQAYSLTDQPDVATEAWARGWTALTHRDRVDLRLADALVQHVFEQQDTSGYVLAASAYLAMLAHLDAMSPAMDPLRARHLAPLALILPDEVREEIGLAEAEEAATAALSEGAGARLVAWWRRMDPLPATPQNERLVEHLERVVYARAHFADERSALGFDDRGKVYVRLGAPSHQTPIRMNQSEPSRATVDDPLSVYYPEGEFWVYRHVDTRAHYLFVRKGRDAFRLGQPEDLVPVSLRSQPGTLALLKTMEGIYRMLALYHPAGHYGSTYDQMANFRGLLDDVALARTLLSPLSAYKVPPRLAATVHTLVSRARSEDRRAVWKRDEQVAPSFSNLFDEVDDLPVVLRWARFLDDDGSTRTELYWGLQARALRPSKQVRRRLAKAGHDPSSTYLLNLTVVQQTATYLFRRLSRKPYLLNAPPDAPEWVLPVQSFVVRGDTGRYHLALQWDAYWAYKTAPDEAPTPGPRVKIGAYRIDTLRALSNDPGRLEMSDLKPLRVAGSVDELDTAPPYPNAVLTPEIGLALYFEVYHLTFGSDDQTHYSLAYDVARRNKGGLLRRDRTTITSAQTRYTGQRRTAHETILLELGDLKGARELEVIVRVTDETTGQIVERSLSFDVREE